MFVHQWKYFNETDINGQGTNRLAWLTNSLFLIHKERQKERERERGRVRVSVCELHRGCQPFERCWNGSRECLLKRSLPVREASVQKVAAPMTRGAHQFERHLFPIRRFRVIRSTMVMTATFDCLRIEFGGVVQCLCRRHHPSTLLVFLLRPSEILSLSW